MQLANEPDPTLPALLTPAEPVANEAALSASTAAEPFPMGDAGHDAETEGAAGASSSLLRAAYVLIFLLTILASYTVWPQAGGQGHLDLMPWYVKLFPPLAFSVAVARASIAAGREQSAWNRRSVAWLFAALVLMGLIGGLTYYYHLQESQEQIDSDDGVMTSVQSSADRFRA